MKIVQTLVVRDEADIVDAQIAYHLNAGVDFVIATDHQSTDGTTEMLESFARDGYLRRIREQGEMHEARWRTSMARLAANEYHADWVINTDADEFWVASRGSLREAFSAIPETIGIVFALSRHFVPRPDDARFFAERMTLRVSASAPLNDPTSPYRPHCKAAHRGDPRIVVRHGAHSAWSPGLKQLSDWYVADVLHFPFRTCEQWERKGVRRATGDKPLGQYVRAHRARQRGTVTQTFRTIAVDERGEQRGLDTGALTVDTRIRDALRELRTEDVVAGPAPGAKVRFRTPGAAGDLLHGIAPGDEMARLAESAALRDAELVRLHRHLDELAARTARVEKRFWARTRRGTAR
ncbi:MAG: glycosyltransferase family 2 protein [Gaiella sp.]